MLDYIEQFDHALAVPLHARPFEPAEILAPR